MDGTLTKLKIKKRGQAVFWIVLTQIFPRINVLSMKCWLQYDELVFAYAELLIQLEIVYFANRRNLKANKICFKYSKAGL